MIYFEPSGLAASPATVGISLENNQPNSPPAARVARRGVRCAPHHAIPRYAPDRLGCDLARWKTPAASVSAAATSSRAVLLVPFLTNRVLPWSSFRTMQTDRLAASNGRDCSSMHNGPSTASWRTAPNVKPRFGPPGHAGNYFGSIRAVAQFSKPEAVTNDQLGRSPFFRDRLKERRRRLHS